MRYIKVPFNFVAVSNEVYFPGWANQISHDIPFSDGLSGQITVELKAETPIFIRDSKDPTRFCHVIDENGHKKFFIPGTSLKGTIRSVLEILSFGKMDKINDHKYAIRDLHNREVYNLMADSQHIHCGWLSLKKDENNKETGSIRDCDIPWRINHKQLDSKLGTSFVDTFKVGGTADFGNPLHKTAKYKYDTVARGMELIHQFAKTTTSYGRQLCDFSAAGGCSGELVFTGQAGARKTTGRPSGKFYEFVFIEPSSYKDPVVVDAKIWEEFKFHYFDHTKQISADWKWRKEQLESGKEIPVFFRLNSGGNSKAKDLGLAYLYKMPYKYSVKDLLPPEHKLGFFKPDMAECIFGNASETDALKGRVQFSPAWADMNTIQEIGPFTTILGTPNGAYCPIYIKQSGENGQVSTDRRGSPIYKTYMDPDAKLAGPKRYAMREQVWSTLPLGTGKMNVKFKPLEAGAKFTAKIHYFNLRPAEYGALLSALIFHNNANNCYHGLGMVKPYGFGRVSIKIKNGIDVETLKKYLKEFESEVTASMQVEDPEFLWHESESVKQFIALSKIQKIDDDRLSYMKLKEFADAKKRGNGFYLDDFISISGDSGSIESLINSEIDDDLKERAKQANEKLKNEIKAFAREEEAHKEEEERKEKQKKAAEEKAAREASEKVRQERMEKEQEAEKRRLEEERLKQEAILKEIEQREQEEKVRIKERNIQLRNTGLAPLINKEMGFQKAKKIVDPYMKRTKVNRLNDEDTSSVMEKAIEWYESTPNKNKGKRWKPMEGPDWKKIASWVGDDVAKEWYRKLGKKE